MIKASDLPKSTTPKINVEALLNEIEKDAINHKFAMDGRNYEVPFDSEGISEVKRVLTESGFDAISNLTGYRNGLRCVTLLVSLKRD